MENKNAIAMDLVRKMTLERIGPVAVAEAYKNEIQGRI